MSPTIVDTRITERNHLRIARIKSGDISALGELYDDYSPVLLGVILRIVGNSDKAEEILQAVFLEINARIEEAQPENRPLLMWMVRIAVDSSNKFLQSDADSPTSAIQTPANTVSHPNAANTGNLLDLVYLKNISLTDAAQLLGISSDEAKMKLRTELNKYRTGNPDA